MTMPYDRVLMQIEIEAYKQEWLAELVALLRQRAVTLQPQHDFPMGNVDDMPACMDKLDGPISWGKPHA